MHQKLARAQKCPQTALCCPNESDVTALITRKERPQDQKDPYLYVCLLHKLPSFIVFRIIT